MKLRHGLETQKERMNSLLRRDVRTPFEVVAVPEAPAEELDLEAARMRALAQRPDVARARLQVVQADYDRRLKTADSLPDLSLSVNYVRLFHSEVIPANISTAGVLFSWDPFTSVHLGTQAKGAGRKEQGGGAGEERAERGRERGSGGGRQPFPRARGGARASARRAGWTGFCPGRSACAPEQVCREGRSPEGSAERQGVARRGERSIPTGSRGVLVCQGGVREIDGRGLIRWNRIPRPRPDSP